MKKALIVFVVFIALSLVYYFTYSAIFPYDDSSNKLQPLQAAAINDSLFLQETNYENQMLDKVLPFVESKRVTGKFSNNNHHIAYEYYLIESPKSSIVISHGFSERKEKYRELAYYFLNLGYQVFIMDHYSHGHSDRISNDSSLIYVERYEDFTEDLKTFIVDVVKPQSKNVPVVLFGHSMGGAIAARTIQLYPNITNALVLNAPMMKMTNLPPDAIKHVVSDVMLMLNQDKAYALGQKPFNPETDQQYQPKIPTTNSAAKGRFWHKYTLSITKQPSRGASWKLVSEFLRLTHDVTAIENIKRIQVPVLMFQAEDDGWVDGEGQLTFANHCKNIQFYLVKGAKHEIYIEQNEVFIPYFNTLNQFILQSTH